MKRRELLKALPMVVGGAFCRKTAWAAPGQGSDAISAVAIRGLIRRGDKLWQPIQVTVQNAGTDATVVTSAEGVEIDRRTVGTGAQTFQVLVAPVSEEKDLPVTIAVGEKKTSTVVKLQPVRKMLIYVLPHSHHDLGYTSLQAVVEEKQMHNIELAMELARKTADYPAGARFVWNLEVMWGADLFMRRKPEAEKNQFLDAVRNGSIAINGMYANELTGLCRPEELLQLFRYSKELGAKCGVTVDSAMSSDVPGYTWGTVTAMAQAGIRYFSHAPNTFDRIGTLMREWQDKPFWAVSPSGKERILTWVPWDGYSLSHGEIKTPDADFPRKYQDRMDAVKFPYEISYVRWSGRGDNAEPDPRICDFIKDWNQEYEWPKFAIASTHEAFSAFDKKYGKVLPEFRGDLTPYWEDGAGSSALETKMSRNAADRLVQAEALGVMTAAGISQVDVNEAWRNILLYSEHTWGAAGSVADADNPNTIKQWEFKRNFAVTAEKLSGELLDTALRGRGAGGDAAMVEVYNAVSWPRTEVVTLSAAMSAAGDRVRDGHGVAVPSQRLSSGELAFVAHEVPGFGSARFHVSAEKAFAPARAATFKGNILENGVIAVKIDGATGNIVELWDRRKRNLVDVSQGEMLNEYLFLEGKDISKLQSSGPVTIKVEENGPLVVSLRIESTAPGCNSLVRKVRLVAGADHVELTNLVDKKRGPQNPTPGKGGQTGEFAQRGGKESVQFAFPFAVKDGALRMDIPLAEMRPESDQLSGASKNWLPVGRWIDVSNAEHGVTWATLDAPLVEIGEVSANLLGSQRDPALWRKSIGPTQRFYSWVMNNHWGTNYRGYQEGVVAFRYAVRPHEGYDAAASSRFAIGLSQPLLVTAASAGAVKAPLLKIEPDDVLALAMKTSNDGESLIVRLFGASGEARKARLIWPGSGARTLWLSDLSEQRLSRIEHEVDVAGWDLVTVRADLPRE